MGLKSLFKKATRLIPAIGGGVGGFLLSGGNPYAAAAGASLGSSLGGGGGGSQYDIYNGVPVYDPAIAEQERLATEQALREEEQRQREEEQRQKEEAFQSALGGAQQSALGGATDYFSGQGLDPTQYQDAINRQIQEIVSGIPQFDPNPASYLRGGDIGQTVFNTEQDAARQRFENELYGIAPSGYATSRIPDTADDAILQAILQGQEQTALDALGSAQSRGVLNPQGYQSALEALGQQRTEANSRLGQIGGDVLEQGRTGLRGIRDEGLENVGQYRLGGPAPDIQGIGNRLNQSFSDFNTNLEGSIRSSLGGDSLFDVGRLIGSARQPSFNPAQSGEASALAAALAKRDEERNQLRGIGNTGSF